MSEQPDPRETSVLSRDQFNANATKYADSPVHRAGASLPVLLKLAAPRTSDRALDVATGTGHTARYLAPHVKEIIGIDVAVGMLEQARRLATEENILNIEFREANAEQLPWPNAAFSLVTSRHAPHHFRSAETFLHEVARVLEPGGRFILVDQISPTAEVAAWIDEWERTRDPSHHRQRTVDAWQTLASDARLRWERDELVPYPINFSWWVQQAGATGEVVNRLIRLAENAPRAAKEAMQLEFDRDGRTVTSFIEPMMVARMSK